MVELFSAANAVSTNRDRHRITLIGSLICMAQCQKHSSHKELSKIFANSERKN